MVWESVVQGAARLVRYLWSWPRLTGVPHEK